MDVKPGDHSEEVPPVPIPNTEVKLFSADGTASRGGGRVGRRQAFLFPPNQYTPLHPKELF